jgi:DNA invertase Pin-like site-specific DNA recombinase
MRVVGYIRVSSPDQVEGYSLAAQERAIEEYCRAREFVLVPVYREEGVSARSDRLQKRPELVRALSSSTWKPGR